jgi:hypothetical protein
VENISGVSGIYCLIHRDSGKCYVGSSVDLWERGLSYAGAASSKLTRYVMKAVREFGIESFDFEVLDRCAPEFLVEREEFYIALMNSVRPHGFNVLRRPCKSPFGSTLDPDIKASMSVRKSELMSQNWSDPEYRKFKSAENKEIRTRQEARDKTGKLSKKMWAKPGHREKFISAVSKPLTITYPGGRVDNYPSLKAALMGTGECRVEVWKCMKAGIPTKEGLVFTYLPKTKPPGQP